MHIDSGGFFCGRIILYMTQGIKLTFTDKILRATFLKLIPKRVTPNQVTIFRFFSIPFVISLLFLEQYKSGLILFIISAFSDAVVGSLARTRNMITEWGETFDPLADKLLISLTALIVLPKILEFQIIFAIIFIEMILIGFAYYRINSKHIRVSVNFWGKMKMLFQSLGVGLVLLNLVIPSASLIVFGTYAIYASFFFALVSLFTYGI